MICVSMITMFPNLLSADLSLNLLDSARNARWLRSKSIWIRSTVKSKNCLIVNLCGGPGCGKSTAAAYISYYLKKSGVNCELATEFAKDMTWEMNLTALDCQPYIFGEQCWKIDRCKDKVSVIVTDSPLFLSAAYNKDPNIEPEFSKMA